MGSTGRQPLPRTCVIGAGMSGLVTARALKERGIPYVQYEMSDRVGGLWVYENPSKRSAAYSSLHLNSSRDATAFDGFPFPDSVPTYPSHRDVASYFSAFADHHGLREQIRFSTEVRRCEPLEGGGWRVSADDDELFDALLVCNGHHWSPHLPPKGSYPGNFGGDQVHSFFYRTPEVFAGRKVVVVGLGNSALDIATDLASVAEAVYLSVRRGAYIAPKFMGGIPTDQVLPKILSLPGARRLLNRDRIEWIATQMIRAVVGDMERYGLPKPAQRLFQSHISVHSYIFGALGDGSVRAMPGIASLEQDGVRFVDGRFVEADVIIWCTGYDIRFPFFDDPALTPADNRFPLYWNVFSPSFRDLAFIGLIDAQSSIHKLAELQARAVGDYLVGKYALPSEADMKRACEDLMAYREKTWIESRRHRVEWHYFEYIPGLMAELERGAERARRLHSRVPVPVRNGTAR